MGVEAWVGTAEVTFHSDTAGMPRCVWSVLEAWALSILPHKKLRLREG